jgi:hypothetical protein
VSGTTLLQHLVQKVYGCIPIAAFLPRVLGSGTCELAGIDDDEVLALDSLQSS